jgi:hypothetical protein
VLVPRWLSVIGVACAVALVLTPPAHKLTQLVFPLGPDPQSAHPGGVDAISDPRRRWREERTVPLPRFLAEQITASIAGKGPDDLVFQGTRGGVLRNGNFNRRTFGAAAIAIGEQRLTPHALRHTAASLAIAAGATSRLFSRCAPIGL